MAKTLLVQFFSLILLYLTAGSFLFLHAGFVGDSPRPRGVRETLGASEMDRQASLSDTRGLGITSRRYGPPWMKRSGQEGQETVHREGDFTSKWNRALKGLSSKDVDDARDNRCMDRKFLPTPAKELVALTSFPGSGNTWTRHLIELATGFYTGSVYFDGSLYNEGFKGEMENWQSRRTICVKTHKEDMKNVQAFQAGILLIRNPYKALMAEFNRQHGGHTRFASQADWSGKDWPDFVWLMAPQWASHALDWLVYGKKVKVILYEDLKTNLLSTLKEMVQFLGLEVSEDRLLCVEAQKDGNFKRQGQQKLEYDPYTPAMEAIMNELIRKVDAALKERKLPGIAEEYVR